jgi:hypothetical protein
MNTPVLLGFAGSAGFARTHNGRTYPGFAGSADYPL